MKLTGSQKPTGGCISSSDLKARNGEALYKAHAVGTSGKAILENNMPMMAIMAKRLFASSTARRFFFDFHPK